MDVVYAVERGVEAAVTQRAPIDVAQSHGRVDAGGERSGVQPAGAAAGADVKDSQALHRMDLQPGDGSADQPCEAVGVGTEENSIGLVRRIRRVDIKLAS